MVKCIVNMHVLRVARLGGLAAAQSHVLLQLPEKDAQGAGGEGKMHRERGERVSRWQYWAA